MIGGCKVVFGTGLELLSSLSLLWLPPISTTEPNPAAPPSIHASECAPFEVVEFVAHHVCVWSFKGWLGMFSW